MRKSIVIIVVALAIGMFSNTATAQVNVSINIGNQPAWGPTGYDYAGYYYLPELDSYYDVNLGMFYYLDRGRWVSARYLPNYYSRYDLYRLHKVVINTNRPWLYNYNHRSSYASYKGYHNQLVIRDSRDQRYYSSRNNRTVWYDSRPSGGRNYYSNRNNDNNNNGYNNNNDRKEYNKKEYNYVKIDNNRSDRSKNTSSRNDNRGNRNDNRSNGRK